MNLNATKNELWQFFQVYNVKKFQPHFLWYMQIWCQLWKVKFYKKHFPRQYLMLVKFNIECGTSKQNTVDTDYFSEDNRGCLLGAPKVIVMEFLTHKQSHPQAFQLLIVWLIWYILHCTLVLLLLLLQILGVGSDRYYVYANEFNNIGSSNAWSRSLDNKYYISAKTILIRIFQVIPLSFNSFSREC